MAFEDIEFDMNQKADAAGIEIYERLRERFPNETVRDYDLILNTLCKGILCLMKDKVESENRPVIIQVVHKILMKNYQT